MRPLYIPFNLFSSGLRRESGVGRPGSQTPSKGSAPALIVPGRRPDTHVGRSASALIEPLDRARHRRETFDCGRPILNTFLRQYAAQQKDKGISQTFVMVEDADSRSPTRHLATSQSDHMRLTVIGFRSIYVRVTPTELAHICCKSWQSPMTTSAKASQHGYSTMFSVG